MLLPMLKAQWISLKRDRLALFLVFVLPVIFFSVFAIIFGGGAGAAVANQQILKSQFWIWTNPNLQWQC